jgi:hypothetical protein
VDDVQYAFARLLEDSLVTPLTVKPGAVVFQVKVTLDGITPAIWRRFLLPGNTKLEQVHECIQGAFGWQNCHLHEFEIAGKRYGNPDSAVRPLAVVGSAQPRFDADRFDLKEAQRGVDSYALLMMTLS